VVALSPAEPGSRAATDALGMAEGSGAAYAGQNISMALDHLGAWRSLLLARLVPGFAHMTLLRAAIEGSATARWLLESDSTGERSRRAAVFRLEDLRHRRSFEAEIERLGREEALERGEVYEPTKWEGKARSGAQRYDDQLAAMNAADIKNEPPPALTSLVDTFGPGAYVYRLTSAFAHRREWAFSISDELDRVEDTGLAGTGAIQVEASPEWALEITVIAVEQIELALAALEAHLGRGTGASQVLGSIE
jgi:hypothetical protein